MLHTAGPDDGLVLPDIDLPDVERRRMILHLARNVAAARQRAGWTQNQLARAADLSRATIHLIEAGVGDPRLSTVTSLAKALNRSALSLFAGQGEVGE